MDIDTHHVTHIEMKIICGITLTKFFYGPMTPFGMDEFKQGEFTDEIMSLVQQKLL
ncbi:hypothetical protein ACJIZ3_013184 [Penstemon smallii]|uniref:Uncharacterized protein n=1 Tax=Penstemon smallii TaxID=265156 RepID=A0ABD3USR1_9LAMI